MNLPLFITSVWFGTMGTLSAHSSEVTTAEMKSSCLSQMQSLPTRLPVPELSALCERAHRFEKCKSVGAQPIFHFDRGEKKSGSLKILVFGVIHGDEPDSGALSLLWLQRLQGFTPRNDWRIVPMLNPDGYAKRTRTNGSNVDLNRNFPTNDWDQMAHKHWQLLSKKSDPRFFPGPASASEPETRCAVEHLKDFNPDIVVAVHTPYGIVDFDGPTIQSLRGAPLPVRRLGNFPGSLGRYLWSDRGVPVLTIELTERNFKKHEKAWVEFQDKLGTFAIQIKEELARTRKKND